MNIKEKVIKIKSKLAALYLACKHKDTPIVAKIIICITLGYALSPIDIIPDFIPILGYVDDIILLPILILISIHLIPKNIMLECEKEAKGIWKNGKPKRWYYALPIILIWVYVIIMLYQFYC
jgi:uncharacterized membrane protein YkvA (DUF1232 family)